MLGNNRHNASLSELLKADREANHYSLTTQAAKANIDKSYLSRLEKGERNPSWETAGKLASLLNVTPEVIMASAKNQHNRDFLREGIKQKSSTLSSEKIEYANLGPTGFAPKQNFSGRQKERKSIVDWYVENKYPILTLCGMHGQGCSSLAWNSSQYDILGRPIPDSDDDLNQVLHPKASKNELRFFWISFVDRKKSLKDVLKGCYDHYRFHYPELEYPIIDSLEQIIAYLIHIFDEAPTLIVLDGVTHHLRDFYEDYKINDMIEFIEQLSVLINCRTIVTTHMIPKDVAMLAGCQIMKLGPLPEKDSLRYLKRRGIKASEEQLSEYIYQSMGNPLALEKIADQLLDCQKIPGLKKPRNSRLLERIRNDFIANLGEGTRHLAKLCTKYSRPEKRFVFTYNDLISDESWQPLGPEKGCEISERMLELEDYGLLGSEDRHYFYLHPVYFEILLEEEKEVR